VSGIAIAAFILLFGIIHQSGYVFSGIYIVKGGTLAIEGARPQSDVFIDTHRVGTVGANGSGKFNALRPGKRNVIVASPNSWPWIFDFEASAATTITFRPLQVLKVIENTPLADTEDPIRARAEVEFKSYREPIRIQALKNEGALIWVEGNTVFAQLVAGDVHSIFSSTKPIRNVLWYGNRNDAVIIAAQDSVFAIDAYESDVRNFQPIYQGEAPEAVADPLQPDRIFIRDKGNYFYVNI